MITKAEISSKEAPLYWLIKILDCIESDISPLVYLKMFNRDNPNNVLINSDFSNPEEICNSPKMLQKLKIEIKSRINSIETFLFAQRCESKKDENIDVNHRFTQFCDLCQNHVELVFSTKAYLNKINKGGCVYITNQVLKNYKNDSKNYFDPVSESFGVIEKYRIDIPKNKK